MVFLLFSEIYPPSVFSTPNFFTGSPPFSKFLKSEDMKLLKLRYLAFLPFKIQFENDLYMWVLLWSHCKIWLCAFYSDIFVRLTIKSDLVVICSWNFDWEPLNKTMIISLSNTCGNSHPHDCTVLFLLKYYSLKHSSFYYYSPKRATWQVKHKHTPRKILCSGTIFPWTAVQLKNISSTPDWMFYPK